MEINTIVVGAGPAGLAVGACLKRAGIPSLILEETRQVGAAWRQHYDRLHLHTSKANSALPFAPFSRDYPRYPSRLQVIEYLETYARRFQLEVRFGQRVIAAHREDELWIVQTQDALYTALNLVIATGYNWEPYIPSWPGQTAFRGAVLHSSQYKNGEPFKGQQVLVVGFGNSGGEIAIDLCESGALTSIAVRSPANVIPRDLFGISIQSISIVESWLPPRLVDAMNAPILNAVIGDLTRYGLRRPPRGPVAQIATTARIPLIDVGTIRLIKQGRIGVYPGIERFSEQGVLFTDGAERQFDAVILATGYRPRANAFLEGAAAAFDEDGAPSTSGRESPVPGLYFCGYTIPPTGVLREIAIEARWISADIAQKHAVSTALPQHR